MPVRQLKRTFPGYTLLVFALLFAKQLPAQLLNIDSCLQVLKTLPEDTNKAKLLSDIAWDISYRDLQEGANYANQSIVLVKKLGYGPLYSRVFHVAGSVYQDLSEQGKALEYFLESLKYAKKYNQLNNLGFVYNSLGNFYSRQENQRRAIAYYMQSVESHKKAGFEAPIYKAYNNMGSTYMKMGNKDSAIFYIHLCVAYNNLRNDPSRLLYNYMTLSEIYSATAEKSKALGYADTAVKLARRLTDRYTLVRALIQQSNALYVNGKYDQAKAAVTECLAIAKEISDLTSLQQGSLLASVMYEKTNDHKTALAYFKEFKSYGDSLTSSENISQIRSAEAKYENEKKQKEIELLAEKQKLSEAKREKDKLYLYVAIGGIVGLAGLILLLFRNNRSKQKTNKELAAYNREVKYQKELVEGKNKEITDSIHYAQRIQQSILTSHGYFEKHTREFFILFQPKDIVSGDFYWALKHENKLMVMTADCTGHGVPGAMMSMMGINFLNEIVSEKKMTQPAAVLNQLRKEIIKALNPEGSLIETKDGMDCSLCSFDLDNMQLSYANANNGFYLIRKNKILTSQVSKMPVGAGHNSDQLFGEFVMDLEKDDLVITFTDGYADQFGGPKGKKFKYKQLEELLLAHAHLPMNEIRQKLIHTINAWKDELEQVDDICIIGIKI